MLLNGANERFAFILMLFGAADERDEGCSPIFLMACFPPLRLLSSLFHDVAFGGSETGTYVGLESCIHTQRSAKGKESNPACRRQQCLEEDEDLQLSLALLRWRWSCVF